MRITLNSLFPSVMDTQWDDKHGKIEDFFDLLEKKDDEILFTIDNVNKIINIFNQKEKIHEIMEEVQHDKKTYGFLEHIQTNFFDYIIRNDYIIKIESISCFDVINKDLANKITEAIDDFSAIIMSNIEHEQTCRFDKFDKNRISIENLTGLTLTKDQEKEYSGRFNLLLSANYRLKSPISSAHFVKQKELLYNASYNSLNNETRVTVKKPYHLLVK